MNLPINPPRMLLVEGSPAGDGMTSQGSGAGKPRILVVEDEAIIASDIQQQLVKLGYEPVGHAVSGEAALELARELTPDLVLMDIQLAGDMDGIAAAKAIRELSSVPVVFLTAFGEDHTFERARHTDPFGYVVKPFSERELRATLAIALYKHGVEMQLKRQALALQASEERHRQTNARIGHLNHVLRAIQEVSSLLNCEQNALKLLTGICDSLVKTRGYLTVWMGQPETGSKQVVPVAHSGGNTAFLQHAPITWDDSPSGQGPTGTAIRERRAVVFNDVAHDPRFAPWRDAVVASGCGAIASIPIIHNERLFGALTIKADRPDAFDEEEVVLLAGLAKDVARTLHNLEAEAARQAADAALAQSHSLLNATLESTTDGILVVDAHGQVTSYNQKFLELWQVPAELAARRDDQALLQSTLDQLEEPAVFLAKVKELYHAPEASSWDEFKFRDGRIFERYSQPQRIGDDIVGRVWSFRDVTGRKRAEIALQESELLLRSILENSQEVIFVKDRECRFLFMNPAGYRFTGLTPEKLLGRSKADLVTDPAAAARFMADDRRVMESSLVETIEEDIGAADGARHWFLTTKVARRDNQGQVIGLIGVAHDITERKRAEEKMKLQISALTAAASAIIITDRNGKIEWVNPAFTKLTGYSSDDVVGNYPRILKSGQHSREFYANLWQTILAGNVWRGELVNRHKDGTAYAEELTITPVHAADGQISHFVAIVQDISERRQFENRLRQSQKMEAIGTLAGGIAHDFNNILAAIFGYSHLLQEDVGENVAAREDIAELLKSASRAKDLVQQILTFSRPRDQKHQVIRLDTVVKEAAKFLRATLPAQVQIEMHLAADTPAVLADPTQIHQVTMNLATNASHAMEGRSGILTINLESVRPDATSVLAYPELRETTYARLTIADTGCGMDAKLMERIFEPFFTTKPVGKGTGLGLAVVHGIMQSHHGVITLESKLGQGTTFRLYFPAHAQADAVTTTATGNISHGHGERILLVDDEPALTATLQRILVRQDYQVTIADHPRAAINLCQQNPALFDLIITDFSMPDINGVEMARQIHALHPELPIVLASGFIPDLNQEELRAAGICELLEKPVSVDALGKVIQRVLVKRQ